MCYHVKRSKISSELRSNSLFINSVRAQEIAINKIATSRLLIDNGLPTPKTIISQTHEPILNALDEFGILLLKSTILCGGLGHRVLRRRGAKITTFSRGQSYQVIFGERNHIRDKTIVLGPPYYAQQFYRRCDKAEQRPSVANVRCREAGRHGDVARERRALIRRRTRSSTWQPEPITHFWKRLTMKWSR